MGSLESSVRSFYERFGQGDMDGATSIYHDDVVTVDPALGRATSLAEWRAYGEAFRRASPDAHMVLHTVLENEDTVAVEATFAGTFTGPWHLLRARCPRPGRRSRCLSLTSSDSATGGWPSTTSTTTNSP